MQKLFKVKSIVFAVVASAIFMVHTPVVHADYWSDSRARDQARDIESKQRQMESNQRDQESKQRQMESNQRDAERRQDQRMRDLESKQRDAERKQRW